MLMMDEMVTDLVEDYIRKNEDGIHRDQALDVYIVWKAKIFQNFRYMLTSTVTDGVYYEVIYDSNKKEFLLDTYKICGSISIRR